MAGSLSAVVAQSQTYTVNAAGNGAAGQIFATNTINSTRNSTLSVDQTGTIDLRGDKADIRVNGESLMGTLRAIQDHLNMLRPNPALEAEWDELRSLGDQYRKLEAEFKEKSKMWNVLKK